MTTAPAGPIRSMTGSAWSREPGTDATTTVVVEVRSVNGKGLSVKPRLPAELVGCERAIEERVRARVSRGSLIVQVVLERAAAEIGSAVDAGRFELAAAHLRALADRAGLAAPSVGEVLLVPGVVASSGGVGSDLAAGPSFEAPAEVLRAVDVVVDKLCLAREQEGEATAMAVRRHLEELEDGAAAISVRAPAIVDDYRARLIERVNEFLDGRGLKLDPQDVVRELGVFADRVDIREELQRLAAHIARARAMLDAGGQVGRPLEFLCQELLRETNTIGSKSPDVDVAHAVVAMKSAVDGLKEQVANLE